MASQENMENLVAETNNDKIQKEDATVKKSDQHSCVEVTEQTSQREIEAALRVTDSVSEKESNSNEEKSSSNIAANFEMAANNTLPNDFKGFKSFGKFRRLDISKLNEILKLNKEEAINDYKTLVNEKDDSMLSLNENDDSQKSVNHNIPIENSEITENGNADKKPVAKKKLKRRKKWIIKKKPCVPKQKQLISTNMDNGSNILYHDLYQKCLDVTNSDGFDTSNKPKPAEENVSGSAIPEKKPLLGMALEIINKLKKDTLDIKKERELQQQTQKLMLHKLIQLLKEKAPVNGDIDYENNLPSHQISSDPPTLASNIHKLKNNFYGFRSVKPQTRDRGGIITAEKLFANSPPSSPTRGGSTDNNDVEMSPTTEDMGPLISSNNIGDLDFVFKPLSDKLVELSTDKPVSRNLRVKGNGFIRNGRTQPIFANTNLTRTNNSKMQKIVVRQMKNVNRKLLNGTKIIRNLKSKNEKDNLLFSTQFKDKSETIIGDIPPLKVISLFTHRSSKDNQAKQGSDSAAVATKTRFSFRGSSVHTESPEKSGTISSINNVSTSAATHQKMNRPSLKRKMDDVMNTETNSKIPATSRDIKISRSVSVTSTENRTNRLQTAAKIQQTAIQSRSNSSLKEYSSPMAISRSFSSRNNVETQSPKFSPKSPSNNSEVSILYYPVHPFISHDLPVHFIPIDANKIPHFLPLYAPNIDAQSKAPIYPSFIRTRPSTEQKSATEYVLSKGISTRSIPHRSFCEDKVRQNLFPGIASGSKCPLLPEVKASSLSLRNKSHNDKGINSDPDSASSVATSASAHRKQSVSKESLKESLLTSLSNGSANTLVPNINSSNNQNQKIHKCLQCGFLTPKLGVLKRHELAHSKGSLKQTEDSKVHNSKMIQSKSLSEVASSLIHAVKKANSVSSVVSKNSRNQGSKTVKAKVSRQKVNEQKRNSGRITSHAVKSSLISRFPSVTVTPVYSKTK